MNTLFALITLTTLFLAPSIFADENAADNTATKVVFASIETLEVKQCLYDVIKVLKESKIQLSLGEIHTDLLEDIGVMYIDDGLSKKIYESLSTLDCTLSVEAEKDFVPFPQVISSN